MKFLCVLLLAFAAGAHVDASITEVLKETGARLLPPPRPALKKSSLVGLLPREAGGCTSPDKFICAENKLTMCIDNTDTTEDCKDIMGLKAAYCNCDGTDCQASIPTNCPTPPRTTCPANQDPKKMPDNKDCRAFTYCDEGTLYYLRCPEGLVYNPTSQTCSSGPCRVTYCPSTAATRPVYCPLGQNPSYYVFCYKSIAEVRHCSTPDYIAEKTGCVFGCSKSGCFADTDEERKNKGIYYCCIGTTSFKRTQYRCDKDGDVFDNVKGFCTARSTTPGEEPGEEPEPGEGNPGSKKQ